MNALGQFSYTQARLSARHGQRPGEHTWIQLQGIGDLASYLHAARRTSLRQWVMGMSSTHGNHEIEQSLREQFRHYVDEVAGWFPTDWNESIKWIKVLQDLPALQHLLAGNIPQAWLLHDPVLYIFASEHKVQRLDAFRQSDYAGLAAAWEKGLSLPVSWLDQWHQRMPAKALKDPGIKKSTKLFREQFKLPIDQTQKNTGQQRQQLETRLTALFRRHNFQVTAAYAHLGLIALDLEKLRSALLRRALFPDTMKAAI